jgi:hypothetical protein
LVLGIIALTKASSDPEDSRRLAKIGWIVFGVGWAVVIVGFVGLALLGNAIGSSSIHTYHSGSDF